MSFVCFGFGVLEAVIIPDVHDGDGQESGAVAEHSGTGVRVSQAPDDGSCPAPQFPSPKHSTHVDHCTHGHLLAVASPTSERPADQPLDARGRWDYESQYQSADPALLSRPPIA